MSKSEKSHTSMSDSELALSVKGGSSKAFDPLAARYLGTIGLIARKYSAQGYEHRDFVQEGLVGLLYACRTYNPNGGAGFKSYASVVIERRFISIIRHEAQQKTVPQSSLVNIDEAEHIAESDTESPEQLLLWRERLNELKAKLKRKLSKTEYDVLMLHAGGCSYRETAKLLSISEKSVDNALQRARKKLNGCLTN